MTGELVEMPAIYAAMKPGKRSRMVVCRRTEAGCLLCVSHSRDTGGQPQYIESGTGRHRHLTRPAYESYYGTPPPRGCGVYHDCGEPSCLNPEHLFCADARTGIERAIRCERERTGKSAPHALLTEAQAREVLALLQRGMSDRAVAEALSAPRWTVMDIRRGKGYRWLGHVAWIREGKLASTLTGPDLRAKREAAGVTQGELARRLGYPDRSLLSHSENGRRTITRQFAAKYLAALGEEKR